MNGQAGSPVVTRGRVIGTIVDVMARAMAVLGLVAAFSSGCRSVAGPRFEDVTAKSGIKFRYSFGYFSYDNNLESSGSGVAVFDYDGDGKMDILFLNGRYVEGASDPKGRFFAGARNAL